MYPMIRIFTMQFVQKIKSKKHNCTLFVNSDKTLLVLPTFFSYAVNLNGVVWYKRDKQDREEKDISEVTLRFVHNHLCHFFNWVVEYSKTSQHVTIDNHHNFPEDVINHYINDHLVGEMGKGEHTINQVLMALQYYYYYLYKTDLISSHKNIRVFPKYKKLAKQQTKRRTAVSYLTPDLRNILYRETRSLRDELLLRTGGELGLRSRENRGLLLDDFYVGNKKHKGFKSLFAQMKTEPDKMEFPYHLQGIFTKASRGLGGKFRILYIHRSLLEKFKDYFNLERPESNENTLLLNDDNNNKGTAISESAASTAFTETKKRVLMLQASGKINPNGQKLDEDHVHHTLRHCCGTDFFHDKCKLYGVVIDDVTTDSNIYIATAELLGHSTNGKSGPQTTKTYIRSCHIKMMFEKDECDV
jgi:integrase